MNLDDSEEASQTYFRNAAAVADQNSGGMLSVVQERDPEGPNGVAVAELLVGETVWFPLHLYVDI